MIQENVIYMFKRKTDSSNILQDAIYGTGGIPKPEPGAVSVGASKRRRNEQNFFQRLFSPRKTVKAPSGKPKKPGFFKDLFSGSRFKRRKGIDGF